MQLPESVEVQSRSSPVESSPWSDFASRGHDWKKGEGGAKVNP